MLRMRPPSFFDLDLRLCFADGEALRRRDFNPSSLLGRPASEALPAPAWARLQSLYERALAGEHFIVEFEGACRSATSTRRSAC